jgi:hypothetical protein
MALYSRDRMDPVGIPWVIKEKQSDIWQHLAARRQILVHLLESNWARDGFDKYGNLWIGHATWRLQEA